MENKGELAIRFGLVAIGFAAAIGALGAMVAGPQEARAIWVGAGIGLLVQLVLFVGLFVLVFSRQPLLAHGVGMLIRLMVVGLLALFWVPWAGVPAAPLLFSLVAVLFLTTLAEPLLIRFSAVR